MTYDELLAKIEKSEADMCSLTVMDDDKCEPIHEIYKAIRAVVEVAERFKDGKWVNEEFEQGFHVAINIVIQAIEKELK